MSPLRFSCAIMNQQVGFRVIDMKSETMISVPSRGGESQFKNMHLALSMGHRQKMNSGSKRDYRQFTLVFKVTFTLKIHCEL